MASLSETDWNKLMPAFVSRTTEIAGYQLSNDAKRIFLQFHRSFTMDPLPKYVSEMKNDGALKRWYDRFTESILGATQNTLACCYYHRDRITMMEQQIVRIFQQPEVIDYMNRNNTGFALGNTIALDAEYQAFILASRRCLDYLTRGLTAFFRNDGHRFSKLDVLLNKRPPLSVSKTLILEHKFYLKAFSQSLLSKGVNKSTRDLISHYKYISAGVLNVNARGVFFAGGGEKIDWNAIRRGKKLSSIIRDQVDLLQACINGLLSSLISSCHLIDRNPRSGANQHGR